MASGFAFVKGHGTQNDFVVLPDPDASVHGDLAPGLVRALCERRAGLGADGVLRAVRTDCYDDPAAVAARGSAEWFMDYRNADGSTSEMCGNGIRVFALHLADAGLVERDEPLRIGTRAGVRTVRFGPDGRLSVDMGTPEVRGETKVGVGDRSWPALHVSMGNPHAVAFVDSLDDAGPLLDAPDYDETVFPDGVNAEFVVRQGEGHLAMRVHERGSGETRSCGTGACAVMVAAALADGVGRGASYRVHLPGGSLDVGWDEAGTVLLTGPAVLVATGTWRA